MKVEYVDFKDRSTRSAYIAERFGGFIRGRVLDVGCDRALLKGLIPGLEYTGIDFGGTPDLMINLEEIDRLPFEENRFDCVVCSDVLEHLDNLHHIFGELVRVSSRYLIISLPNNWTNARRPLERGRGSFDKYGLPPEPPRDRHKWFFSLGEARDFIASQLSSRGLTLLDMVATEKPRPLVTRLSRRLRYPRQECYLNRYAHTLWALLEKQVVTRRETS
jgi:SAM-dependent methyltransferase